MVVVRRGGGGGSGGMLLAIDPGFLPKYECVPHVPTWGKSLVDTIRSLVTDFHMFISSWHVKALGLGSGHTALWLCVQGWSNSSRTTLPKKPLISCPLCNCLGSSRKSFGLTENIVSTPPSSPFPRLRFGGAPAWPRLGPALAGILSTARHAPSKPPFSRFPPSTIALHHLTMSALRILVPIKRVIDYAVRMRQEQRERRGWPIGHITQKSQAAR